MTPAQALQRCAFSASILLLAATLTAGEPYAIHEWGTFTSLQDESGVAIGGINTDDEPVPKFVLELKRFLLIKPTELPPCFFQGAPHCHPDVTMRLETPVVYFHMPTGAEPVATEFRVAFRGGWLTQYYPAAKVDAPGLEANAFSFGRLRSVDTGRLSWGLKVGISAGGPQTDSRVWNAARAVNATSVKTPNGDVERFLFYRGIGHVNAPLRVVQDEHRKLLLVRAQILPKQIIESPFKVMHLWLVSYFKSPGLRLFFLVPSSWTDFYLPISDSHTHDITRVMMGRIELVTRGSANCSGGSPRGLPLPRNGTGRRWIRRRIGTTCCDASKTRVLP